MGNSTWGTSKPVAGDRLLALELPAPVLPVPVLPVPVLDAIPARLRPMSPPGAAAG